MNKNKNYTDEKTLGISQKFPGIRVMILGGCQQIGMNSLLIETEKDMLIIDAGLGFPEEEMYGIDYLLPNYNYVYKNLHKLRGIVLSHGHFDHFGGLPYILEDFGFPPIYCSRFTARLVEARLKEFGLLKQSKVKEVRKNGDINIGEFIVHFVHVTHSIPDSCFMFVEARGKRIFLTGDYKFDDNPVIMDKTNFPRTADLAKQGIDLMFADSTNSFEQGASKSDTSIIPDVEKIFQQSKGRIITATFSSLLNRLQILISIAEKFNRKVFITGRSIIFAYEIAKKYGYITHKADTVQNVKNINKYSDPQILLMTTGTQAEYMAGLSRMAKGEHQFLRVKKGDTVILSSSAIPGNEALIQRMIDDLIMLGADVINNMRMDVHTSGHAFKGDQLKLLDIVKPKYLIPYHGYQMHLMEQARSAKELGMKEENIIIPRNGWLYEISGNSENTSISKILEVKSDPKLVDGIGISDIGNIVLKERDQLANYGIVVVMLKLDHANYDLLGDPMIFTKGFVYVKKSGKLLDEMKERIKGMFKNWRYSEKHIDSNDLPELKNVIEKKLESFIYKNTSRKPAILTIFT